MSGTIQIAVRTKDGARHIVNGYTRSAYDVFSYISLFDGDDGPARRFLEEWKDSPWGKPDTLEPLEYGLFVVDFITSSIVVDGDEDVGIDRSSMPYFGDQFTLDCVGAGRVTLHWRDSRREPLLVTPDLAGIWNTEATFMNGAPAFGLTREHIVPWPEMRIEFTPWQVRCHPSTEAGRAALFDDIRSCGFDVDPTRWGRT